MQRKDICWYVGFIAGAAPTGWFIKNYHPEINVLVRLGAIVVMGVLVGYVAGKLFGNPPSQPPSGPPPLPPDNE
jgi:hypothetical protein